MAYLLFYESGIPSTLSAPTWDHVPPITPPSCLDSVYPPKCSPLLPPDMGSELPLPPLKGKEREACDKIRVFAYTPNCKREKIISGEKECIEVGGLEHKGFLVIGWGGAGKKPQR